jgi:hypothetical protein
VLVAGEAAEDAGGDVGAGAEGRVLAALRDFAAGGRDELRRTEVIVVEVADASPAAPRVTRAISRAPA